MSWLCLIFKRKHHDDTFTPIDKVTCRRIAQIAVPRTVQGGVTHVVAVHAFVIPAKIKVDFLLKFMLIFVSEKNFSLL